MRVLCSYSLVLKVVADQGQYPTARESGGSASSPERMTDVLASSSGPSGRRRALPAACAVRVLLIPEEGPSISQPSLVPGTWQGLSKYWLSDNDSYFI